MPEIRFSVDHSRFDAKIDHVLPGVEDALEKALKPIATEMAATAQGLALAHIRYAGTKPGQYVASIYGGTFKGAGVVGGFVRSSSPLAHLLELGTQERFRKTVGLGVRDTLHHALTGSTGAMPAYPALAPAFEGAQGRIDAAIESAAKGAG